PSASEAIRTRKMPTESSDPVRRCIGESADCLTKILCARSSRRPMGPVSPEGVPMTSQNRISLQLDQAQLAQAAEALGALEQALSVLIALAPAERRRLVKMGPKSEVFCRQALRVLEQNPHIVPDTVDVASAK